MEICDGMRQEKEQENIKYQSQRPKCMSVVNSSTRADVCGCQRELFLANEEVELRRDFCPPLSPQDERMTRVSPSCTTGEKGRIVWTRPDCGAVATGPVNWGKCLPLPLSTEL
jgi:hypothetical protein